MFIFTRTRQVVFLFSSNYHHRARKFKDRNFTQPPEWKKEKTNYINIYVH